MEVVVKLLGETKFTYQQIVDLMHESFDERLQQGLNFTCSSMTTDQYEDKVKDGFTFVAFNPESEELLGTATLHIRKDKKDVTYGYHEYLAVSPKAKHLGIGTKLLNKRLLLLLLSRGGKYVMSDTACGATSSVNWHLKNGFHIYELESYRSTNYWSFVFIKYLDDSVKRTPLQLKLHFWKSFLFIKTTRNVDGTDTTLGKLYKKMKQACKN